MGCHQEGSEFQQDGNLVATIWQGPRPVDILSTQHSPNNITTVRGKTRDGSMVSVACRQAIVDYTSYMGGVDVGDQCRNVRMKSCRSYKHILFEVCIYNSLY